MIIHNGVGNGNKARVTKDNRLDTNAINENQIDHAAELGDRYNLNTGDINLTSANESSVFYLKNNEDKDLYVASLIYNLGTSTGGSGDWVIDVYRNPTAGTVVSDATAVEMNSNQNFGSNKTLTADVYKGDEAKTLTDGDKTISTRSPSNGRILISLGALVIPKGTSLGIKITPPASNTSVNVQVAAACFVKNFGED